MEIIDTLKKFYRYLLNMMDKPSWSDPKEKEKLFNQAYGATEFAALLDPSLDDELTVLWNDNYRGIFRSKIDK